MESILWSNLHTAWISNTEASNAVQDRHLLKTITKKKRHFPELGKLYGHTVTSYRKVLENMNCYDTRKPCLFSLSCEEGLPTGMFLSAGRLTTFRDFDNFIKISWVALGH